MKKLGSQNSNCRLRECPLVAPVPFQSGRAHRDPLPMPALPGATKTSYKSRGTSYICVQ